MFALVEVSDEGLSWTDPLIITLLAGSAVLFAVFLWFELRVSQPLVPLRLTSTAHEERSPPAG